jgi:hypothetical protein
MNYISKMNPSGLGKHVNEVVIDMGNLFRGSLSTPLMMLNLVGAIFLSVAAIIQLSANSPGEMIMLSDAAFSDSPSFAINSDIPPQTTYFTDPVALTLSTTCAADDHICRLSHFSPLVVGHSGLFSETLFTLEEKSIHITHILWVVSWFTTPISLFLFANANWVNFEPWLWWVTYVFIFGWNVVGLLWMLFQKPIPVYNNLYAVIYFTFSTMLMFSVREAWRVVTNDGEDKEIVFANVASRADGKIPKIMRVPMQNVRHSYALTAASDAKPVAVEIRYIFSQTALAVTEMFFLIPVLNMVATVMVHHRVTQFDLQTRYWFSTIFFGSLVLMEKSRRVGVTYMTDAFLVALGIFSGYAQIIIFVGDFIFMLQTRELVWHTLVVYIIILTAHVIGICIIVCNAMLAGLIQKTHKSMVAIQEDESGSRSKDEKILETFEKWVFISTMLLLIVCKFMVGALLLSALLQTA